MAEASIIDARGFSKTFSGRRVLRDVDLAVAPGEIHALVGQNGSGKSTFIKILSAYHAPDPGATLSVRGRRVELPLAPDVPGRLGLSFVHQDLGLFEDGSVLENLLVGQYRTSAGWRIPWRSERARARSILMALGPDVDPDAPLRTLSEVDRTVLAIARALSRMPASEGALLVLDEPTARLPHDSVEEFFARVRTIARRGHAVLFVSHRLDEVVELADRVTVLRDGGVSAHLERAELSVPRLVHAMLGEDLGEAHPDHDPGSGEVILHVDGLSGGAVERFDADLHRGEILGLTGLLGMGHDRIPYLLFGASPATAGRVTVGDRVLDAPAMTPRRSIELGIALLPGNRARDSGVGDATTRENMTLATLRSYFRDGWLRHTEERRAVLATMDAFEVTPLEPDAPMSTLSGGNQQKALLAKWLAVRPRVLLLDEPCHGVDVGAKRQILRLLADAAANDGMAIIVSSVEASDLAELCHRVLVMRRGRIVSELRGSSVTTDRIAAEVQLDQVPGTTLSAATP